MKNSRAGISAGQGTAGPTTRFSLLRLRRESENHASGLLPTPIQVRESTGRQPVDARPFSLVWMNWLAESSPR